MNRLRVDHEVDHDAVTVRAEGDVDISGVAILAEGLRAALKSALEHRARLLVVDLDGVTYFGSAGLNALLDCHEHGVDAGVAVRLVASDPRVVRPLQVTNLDSVLAVYPTSAQARQC
ncbi:STAS domain-containing protein [Nocardia sp. CC227C]|uniref:STAS domain-containing protein n=1 Tax=Nocardia sp. CC227C TaxID=3044562 RepID=UPI00278C1903|nr:STAS domain-containing protein [Nocardia sp. CC227C]